MNRRLLLTILSLSITLPLSAQNSRGGSNYNWYQIDNPGCNREPYGVIYNYDVATTTINSQLDTMRSNGQARLRLAIFHGRGINTGTVMDSTGGNLSGRFRTNLTNLLTTIRIKGFSEVEIGFFPQGQNDPTQWTSYSEDYYQENWNLIHNLRGLIITALQTVTYKIDLLNEGSPGASQAALMQYSQHLWNDYVYTHGKLDTVGVSIIASGPTATDRIGQVATLYGNSQYGTHGYPYLFDLHIYDNAGSSFLYAKQHLVGPPTVNGWIIGEAWFNDSTEASDLHSQIVSGPPYQTVYYLAQWPKSRGSACEADVIPLSFSNYEAYPYNF